jgi:haloalkane dehalogenase
MGPRSSMTVINGIDTAPFGHLYPFRHRFATVNGQRMHFVDEGEGPTVVMLHGNPTWSFYYRTLILRLRDRFRTIAPDHIGCGLSAKPAAAEYSFRLQRRVDDLEALLDGLDIGRRVVLVLHDWGGMIGMAWALRHPGRIAGLVITNTAAFFPPAGKRLPLRLQIIRRGGPLAAGMVLGLNLFARPALTMAPVRPLANDIKKGLLAPYNRPRHRLATLWFVRDIPLGPGDASYELVHSIDRQTFRLADVPALICWGMHDFVFDDDYLAEWQRRLPRARVHRFPNAGHYLLEDAGGRVAVLIHDFLLKNQAVSNQVSAFSENVTAGRYD